MGKLTRRIKYIAKERRLSIPAEFLHHHGIERGDRFVVSALRDRLYALPLHTWEQYVDLSKQLRAWFPDDDHPFFEIVRNAAKLRLGSQDRVVLPRTFPFALETSAKMHWDLVDGILVMEPELATMPGRPSLAEPSGQGNLLDLVGSANQGPLFDRDEAVESLVESISVGRIDWRDRTFADGSSIPGEPLVRSIRVEGLRKPLILREVGTGYQVIDGFRRLAAARQLRMRSVPAIVWRGIDDEACRRLKLMEPPRERAAETTTVSRLQSTLRLHEDQVALKEIEHITGRRKRTLQRYLRVAQEPALRTAIEDGRLSIFKAEEILKAGIDAEAAITGGWTVKRIREEGKRHGRARPRRVHGPQGNDA